jgi:hypothetical protein
MFSRVLSSVALKRAALVGGSAVGLAVSGPSLYAYAPYQDVHTSEKFAEFRQSQEALKTGDATGYNVKVADGDLFLVQSSTMAMNARTPTEEIPEGYQSKFEIFLRSAPSTSPDHLEAESADEEVRIVSCVALCYPSWHVHVCVCMQCVCCSVVLRFICLSHFTLALSLLLAHTHTHTHTHSGHGGSQAVRGGIRVRSPLCSLCVCRGVSE